MIVIKVRTPLKQAAAGARRCETMDHCRRRGDLKWQRQSIREPSLSRMEHSCRTRCDSKVSPARLAGDWSKISMGTDWVEKSAKRDGPSSGWLVNSGQPYSVLTDKRQYAEQSSES